MIQWGAKPLKHNVCRATSVCVTMMVCSLCDLNVHVMQAAKGHQITSM